MLILHELKLAMCHACTALGAVFLMFNKWCGSGSH